MLKILKFVCTIAMGTNITVAVWLLIKATPGAGFSQLIPVFVALAGAFSVKVIYRTSKKMFSQPERS